MSNIVYPVLCGGTFFTLVLEARRQRTSKRSQHAGELDGLSQPKTLAGLGRVVYPEYAEQLICTARLSESVAAAKASLNRANSCAD